MLAPQVRIHDQPLFVKCGHEVGHGCIVGARRGGNHRVVVVHACWNDDTRTVIVKLLPNLRREIAGSARQAAAQ